MKFRCEPDLVEAVAEAARELRISPSEAGRMALRLWLEELERVPDPRRLPSRLVAPIIEVGGVEAPARSEVGEARPFKRRPGETDADAALRRLDELLESLDGP